MRKRILFLALMTLTAAASADTQGRGGLFFGTKSLNHGDWGAFDQQAAWGVTLDFRDSAWPVWLSGAYLASHDTEKVAGQDLEAKTSEIHLGAKKDFYPVSILRLSAAGGPAWIHASLDGGPAAGRASDNAVGYWLGAESVLYLGHFALGLGYNYSHANVKLFSDTKDAGGSNLMFSLGFGW